MSWYWQWYIQVWYSLFGFGYCLYLVRVSSIHDLSIFQWLFMFLNLKNQQSDGDARFMQCSEDAFFQPISLWFPSLVECQRNMFPVDCIVEFPKTSSCCGVHVAPFGSFHAKWLCQDEGWMPGSGLKRKQSEWIHLWWDVLRRIQHHGRIHATGTKRSTTQVPYESHHHLRWLVASYTLVLLSCGVQLMEWNRKRFVDFLYTVDALMCCNNNKTDLTVMFFFTHTSKFILSFSDCFSAECQNSANYVCTHHCSSLDVSSYFTCAVYFFCSWLFAFFGELLQFGCCLPRTTTG